MGRIAVSVDHIARVEGHGDIHLVIEDGRVERCELAVVEPARLFEAMVRGRRFDEAPYIASRVCGICSASHVVTDLRAIEAVLGIEVSARTRALRELLVYGSFLQNHATHLFVFAAPDFLGLGSVFPLAETDRRLFDQALALKALGNELCTRIGGRSIHPITAVTGGFTHEVAPGEYLDLAEKLEGAGELQAWFTRETEQFLAAHGKTLLGWDEITEDGLTPQSAVMWWRSWMPSTLTAALQNGHRVIESPSEFLYLNGELDRNTLGKVYGWEPLPESLRAWEEGLLGWNYRLDDVEGICDDNVFIGAATVRLLPPESAELYYTLDGTVPDTASQRYTAPFSITDSCTLTLRCYNRRGVAAEIRRASFRPTRYAEPSADAGNLQNGLLVRWYDYDGDNCADIDEAPLQANFITDSVVIPDGVTGNIGLICDGYIDIPADGIYSFYTYSDDGSTLAIDGRTVVDNDGLHSRTERSGQAALRRGVHSFSLRYFDTNGGVLEAGIIDSEGRRIPFSSRMLKH